VIAPASLGEATFALGALTFLVAGATLYFARFRPGESRYVKFRRTLSGRRAEVLTPSQTCTE
jgi:hypothetical protein